jgi:hypothetical protein
VPHTETNRYDRYTIEVFCQHCGTYLNTLVGIERNRVSAVRAAPGNGPHASGIGREVEITFHVTRQRWVWFTPEGTP